MASPGQGHIERRLAAIVPAGMRRREFIALLGGAVSWPRAAVAQRTDKVRRIGVLYASGGTGSRNDNAFRTRLQELGWIDGRNVRIDYRSAGPLPARISTFAKELVELQPDVILGESTPVIAALARETRTIAIVFVNVADPVEQGFIANLPRPGGNITGFTFINDNSVVGKWLELLKEIAPRIARIAFLFNPQTSPGGGSALLAPFEAAASSLAMEAIRAPVHNEADIAETFAALGREPTGGVIVSPDMHVSYRYLISALALRHRVPVIYPDRFYTETGGLISYGIHLSDVFRQAASYIDRILRGARPADLPVQQPSKYELVINLKTARALGITVPQTLIVAADEVIE